MNKLFRDQAVASIMLGTIMRILKNEHNISTEAGRRTAEMILKELAEINNQTLDK